MNVQRCLIPYLDQEPHLFLLQEFPELSRGGVGFHFYESSLLLAKFLSSFLKTNKKLKPVLELGSGSCGLVGLALSRLNYEVTFSDLPIILPYLKINVDRNIDATLKDSFSILDLAWGDKEGANRVGQFDLIVGADVVYQQPYILPLLETIFACLSKRGECFLAYEEREEGLVEGYFVEQAKRIGFRVKRIKSSAHPPPYNEVEKSHLRIYKLTK